MMGLMEVDNPSVTVIMIKVEALRNICARANEKESIKVVVLSFGVAVPCCIHITMITRWGPPW